MSIEVFYQRKHVDAPQTPMTGAALRELFSVPAGDDLYRAQGNRTEGPKITNEESVALKNGDRFVSVPSEITGGAVAGAVDLPPRIRREVERIDQELFPVDLRETAGGRVLIVPVEDEDWTPRPLRVLVRIPTNYADEKPDLIYLESSAVWSGGTIPRVMQRTEIAGENWIQVSWHWSGPFDTALDNLVKFVSSIAKYLRAPAA